MSTQEQQQQLKTFWANPDTGMVYDDRTFNCLLGPGSLWGQNYTEVQARDHNDALAYVRSRTTTARVEEPVPTTLHIKREPMPTSFYVGLLSSRPADKLNRDTVEITWDDLRDAFHEWQEKVLDGECCSPEEDAELSFDKSARRKASYLWTILMDMPR